MRNDRQASDARTADGGLAKAIVRSMASRYVVYAANLLSLMLLARLFTPETFGTVAAMSAFFVFFQFLAETGLGPAIINLTRLDASDRDGIFGLTVAFGLVIAAVFWLLAPAFSAFYGLPRIDVVVPYVAVALLFFSAAVLPTAQLLRQQAFGGIGVAGFAAEAISTAAAVALAQFIDPLHALASKMPVSAMTDFVVTHRLCAATEFGQPRIGWSPASIRPLLHVSGYQFGFNLVNYFVRNLDKILIGKYMGSQALGIYDKAYRLMTYPLMLLTFAMTPAIQPVVRQYAQDAERIEAVHRRFTFRLSLLGACAGAALFTLADPLVRLLLGGQWLDVIPVVRILAIAIAAQVVLSSSGSFFQAAARTDLLLLCGLASAASTVTAIVWGVAERDLHALCWAIAAAMHVNFVVAYIVMYRWVFRHSALGFFVRMVPALLVSLGLALAIRSSG